MSYGIAFLKAAHKHSIYNRMEIESSRTCVCFGCKEHFPATVVHDWIEEKGEKPETAWCPFCGIDSVLGDASNLPIADFNFVTQMNLFWMASDASH